MSGFEYLFDRRVGGGKVGIPRAWRDFQAGWESRLFDFSTPRLFHGLSWRRMAVGQRRSLRGIVSEPVRAVGQGEVSVQVLVHGHGAAGKGPAPAHRLDL